MHSLNMSMNETCTVSTNVQHWAQRFYIWSRVHEGCPLWHSVEPPFIYCTVYGCFCNDTGVAAFSNTWGRWPLLNQQIDGYGIKWNRVPLTVVCSTICMVKSKSGACVICVCWMRIISWLIVSLRRGNCFIQLGITGKVGGPRGTTVSFISELKHLCLSKGTLSFNC